jgi:hypothetical protein
VQGRVVQTLLAYFAGAIDADGFVTIQRCTPSPKRVDGRRRTYCVAKLGLSQTDADVPEMMLEQFGGSIHVHTPKNPRHRAVHQWSVTNQKAAMVLRAIRPFLVLKGEQADLACRLAERIAACPAGKPLPPQEFDARAHLYAALTALNKPRNRRVHHLA